MKRQNNLYHKIYDIENLRLAHKNAQRGKKKYKEVIEFNKDPENNLLKIQDMLINKTFKTSKYVQRNIKDSGKIRLISKLPYSPDRIVQWAVLQIIAPIFIRNFNVNTYSAIPNRGIHKALKKLQKTLKEENVKYCLKFDISKYYPSINHEVLKNLLNRKFKDKDLLDLLYNIVDSIDSGIPIGNYTSQFFGNFYLSYFDHWIKETKQRKYYFRYMDDVVILSDNKNDLRDLFNEIETYLNENLKLNIKKNYQIFPLERGIDFLGYRIFKNYTLLRKNICKRFIQKALKYRELQTEKLMCSLASYKGWLKWCNSHNLQTKYLKVA